MLETERKETEITFRVLCNACDFAGDFVPKTNYYEDINASMREAIRGMKNHIRLTDHDPDVRMIPKPSIRLR